MKILRVAATISIVLAIAKGAAFAWTGSIVLLASFLDSFVDSFLSFVNFKISTWSQEGADRRHPYGHGGFEVITALSQGALIAGSGIVVVFQSLDRIFAPKSMENLNMDRLPMAFVVMCVSTVASLAITLLLRRSKAEIASKDERSLSVNADYAHYSGDVLQNIVTIFGIGVTWYWHTPWVDVAAGLVSGVILLKTAVPLIRESIRDIMNTEFDPVLRKQVELLVANCAIPEVKGMHRLRTRSLGPNRFVDFHLKLPNQLPLIEAHEISYRIEALLKKAIPGLDVLMHLDPEDEPDDEFE